MQMIVLQLLSCITKSVSKYIYFGKSSVANFTTLAKSRNCSTKIFPFCHQVHEVGNTIDKDKDEIGDSLCNIMH